MKVLITGTDGFIGSEIRDYLIKDGHRVFGTTYFKEPQTNEIRFDILSDSDFKRLPDADFDAVIHTAGIVDQNSPKEKILAVNSSGTKKILDWCAQRNCRHFIFTSSITVYGLKVVGENRTEDNTSRYKGAFALPYGRSKAIAEEYIEKSSVPFTILRLPAVFGRGESYFSRALIGPLAKGNLFYCGSPDKRYSTLYTTNLSHIIGLLLSSGPLNDSFNCTDHETTWRKLIEEFARNLDVKPPSKNKSLLSIMSRYKDKEFLLPLMFSRFGAHFPNNKLRERLKYEPKHPWQEGVKQAVSGWLEYGQGKIGLFRL